MRSGLVRTLRRARRGVTGAGPAGSAAPLPFRIRRSGDLQTQTWTEHTGAWTQPASVAPVAVAAAAPVTVAGSGWRVERHPESGRCRTRGRARPRVGFGRQERPRVDCAHPPSTCQFFALSRSPCVGRFFCLLLRVRVFADQFWSSVAEERTQTISGGGEWRVALGGWQDTQYEFFNWEELRDGQRSLYATPDLRLLVEEITNQTTWQPGNALVLCCGKAA